MEKFGLEKLKEDLGVKTDEELMAFIENNPDHPVVIELKALASFLDQE